MADCLNAKLLSSLMEQLIHIIPKPFQDQEPAICFVTLMKAKSNKFRDAKVVEFMGTDPLINYMVKVLVNNEHTSKNSVTHPLLLSLTEFWLANYDIESLLCEQCVILSWLLRTQETSH